MTFIEAISRYRWHCAIVTDPKPEELDGPRGLDESIVVFENRSLCINLHTGERTKLAPTYYRFTLVLPVI